MEHPSIEQEAVLDHYLAGQLSAEDEAAFEEHLFVCPDCLRQAEVGEELRRGLAEVQAADTESPPSPAPLAFPRPAPPSSVWRPLAIAAMLVLAPLGALLWRAQGQGDQLQNIQGQLAAVQERLDGAQAELQGLRRSKVATRPAAALRLLPLGVSRSAEAVPVLEISPVSPSDAPAESPDPDAPWVLSLELTATPDLPLADAYEVRLVDAAGSVRFRAEGVEPTPYDTLLVILPQGFLEAGDYVFEVSAGGHDGPPSMRLPLRVGS